MNSFDEVLNLTGFGTVQTWVLMATGFSVMSACNHLIAVSTIMPAAFCDLKMDDVKKNSLNWSSLIGVISAVYLWSSLTDLYGRRWVLVWCNLLSNIVGLASSFMANYSTMLLSRFMIGICASGILVCAPIYLTEFCKMAHRTVALLYLSLFVAFSMVYCACFAYIMLQYTWAPSILFTLFYPWRVLLLLYSVPGIIASVIFLSLPKSPELLLCCNQKEEAIQILHLMYRINMGKQIEKPIKPDDIQCPNQANAMKFPQMHSGNLTPLFTPPLRYKFVVPTIILCGSYFGCQGFGIWLLEIQSRRDHYPYKSYGNSSACDEIVLGNLKGEICLIDINSLLYLIYYGCSILVINCIVGLFIVQSSRTYVSMFNLLVSGICFVCIPFITSYVFSSFLIVTVPALAASVMLLMYSLIIEVVPTYFRGRAVGVAMLCGNISVIICSIMFSYTITEICSLTFLILSLILISCGALSIALQPIEHPE